MGFKMALPLNLVGDGLQPANGLNRSRGRDGSVFGHG
jgi:hypothetical protein